MCTATAEIPAEAEDRDGLPTEVVRSFWLAPASTGVRSFRLASSPFMKRRPALPGAAAGESSPTAVRSFRLAPSSAGVRSFRVASPS